MSASRPVESDWPYLRIGAVHGRVRRIVSVAVILGSDPRTAIGVNPDGRCEARDMDIGPSEVESLWTGALRQLARHGHKLLVHQRASQSRRPFRQTSQRPGGGFRQAARWFWLMPPPARAA
ncbi:transposase [Inquilinus sp. OTU3971]|uniref:transposase n=1 Tax=Inquilinus sp. OTU3971 TaxID=3043855 RepID=UPI00406C5DD8